MPLAAARLSIRLPCACSKGHHIWLRCALTNRLQLYYRMGLAHVFAGGCSEPNDGCADTASMSGPNYNCYPRGSGNIPNSCKPTPDDTTVDPVNKCAAFLFLSQQAGPSSCHSACGCAQVWRLRAATCWISEFHSIPQGMLPWML